MKLDAGARRRFDVAVVGSGPAGISAAWPLVEAGLDVLMVDGAEHAALPTPFAGTIGGLRADPAQWRHRFGDDLSGSAPEPDVSPKFATPLARALTGGYHPALGLATQGFWAAGSLSQGGLSNVWGAVAETFDDADLAAYPIGAADLAPSYQAVMARIGVSDQPPPIPEGERFRSPVQEILRRQARLGGQADFTLKPARNAILDAPRDGREACNQCGLCLWGCGRRSIYNSAYELPALQQFPNFTYAQHTRVLALSDASGSPTLEVEQNGARLMLSARCVVLAAGTISTTALALDRLGLADAPVRLLTNPVGAIAFIVPGLIGQELPERSFSLGQLSYTVPIKDAPDYAAGILYGADTLPLGVIADRLPLGRPTALRLACTLMPALILATCYAPGRFSCNTLRVERRPAEPGRGSPRVTIEAKRTKEADRAVVASARGLARQLRRLGAFAVPGSLTLSQPGADAHYAGTLPMGGSGPAACAPDGGLNGCPGVYVVDGAALSALPARHCTLTIMANADRIARALALNLQTARAV